MTQHNENQHPHYDPQAIENNFRFLEQLPPFWSTQFRDQVIERQPIEDKTLKGLQQQTVKYATYRHHGPAGYGVEASASQLGWCKSISAAHNVQRLYNESVLPSNIKLEITQAPAEFACPVKQDKRMLPDFKVKATLLYDKDQEGLYCPITMRTEVISFEQYAQMCSWSPAYTRERQDLSQDNRRFQVSLKGTREIFHLFATENMRQGHRPALPRFQIPTPQPVTYMNANMNSPYDLMTNTGIQDMQLDFDVPVMQQQHQHHQHRQPQQPGGYHVSPHQVNPYSRQDQYGDMFSTDFYGMQHQNRAQSARYGNYYGGTRVGGGGTISDNAFYDSLSGGGQLQEQGGRANPFPHNQMQTYQVQQQRPKCDIEEKEQAELSHEFVFTNLEFKKPSRMQKVYLVFYTTIESVDLLYILFKMPTVCICRAEQRFRACTLLGIPSYRKPKNYPSPLKLKGIMQGWDEVISTIKSGQDVQLTQGQLWEMSVGLDHDRPPTNQTTQPPHQALQNPNTGLDQVNFPTYSGEIELDSGTQFIQDGIIGQRIWEYVCEEYQNIGLQRELTEKDKLGVWKMSGCRDERSFISKEQNEKFKQDFQKVLQVLMKFAKYWNLDHDVHYMTDWGLTSSDASNLLVDESPGSCILRLSQTSMGSMSLTVVYQQGTREQSVKSIRHFLIKYDQLMSLPSGSLDVFFQKFGAEFIVDPYNKRKTPREKLMSNYTNWEDVLEGLKEESCGNN